MPKIIKITRKQIEDHYYAAEDEQWINTVEDCCRIFGLKSEATLYNHLERLKMVKRGKASDFSEIKDLVINGYGIAYG